MTTTLLPRPRAAADADPSPLAPPPAAPARRPLPGARPAPSRVPVPAPRPAPSRRPGGRTRPEPSRPLPSRRRRARVPARSARSLGSRSAAPGTARPSAAPVRLTRRGRLARFAASAVVIAGALTALGTHVVTAVADSRTPPARTVVMVRPGDTLWGLARSYDPQADPRDVVAAAISDNGLAGATIHPGQQLRIRVAR